MYVLVSKVLAVLVITALIGGCRQSSAPVEPLPQSEPISQVPQDLGAAMEAVKPFFSSLPSPGPEDWLASFNEPGQTFKEYLNSNPTIPTNERKIIYILPLGSFSDEERKVIRAATEYLEAFFGLEVSLLPTQAIDHPLRLKDSRISRYGGNEQVRTGYILDEVLLPILRPDAAALIAFTNDDLFPDESMNYVFGQASLENRVGVWSLYRLKDAADFQTFLSRTLKVAAHESGHMFSIRHCTKYNCVMSGSNHLAETDNHPIDACPECMAKICWFSHISPAERYRKLSDVCRRNGLYEETKEFHKKVLAIESIP
jgi:archaemetzincin